MRNTSEFKYVFGLLLFLNTVLSLDFQAQDLFQDVSDEIINSTRFQKSIQLNWVEAAHFKMADDTQVERPTFENANVTPNSYRPIYTVTYFLGKNVVDAKVVLSNVEEVAVPSNELNLLNGLKLPREYTTVANIGHTIEGSYLFISVEPIAEFGSRVNRLSSFDLKIEVTKGQVNKTGRDANAWKEESVLNSGEWYKFSTGEDGVYRISYADLINANIISGDIPSDNLRLFGTPAGALSMENSVEKIDDLLEFSISVIDGGDGVFNVGDYFLFYGEDQDTWVENGDRFVHSKNPYADSNYYFLSVVGMPGNPNRINDLDLNGDNYESNTYDFFDFHEADLNNLIKSGRRWFGEPLGSVPKFDFGFSVPNVVTSETAYASCSYAARSVGISGTKMKMSIPNQSVTAKTNSVTQAPSGYATTYAFSGTFQFDFKPIGANFNTSIEYDNTANPQATAWIDEIEINARRSNVFLSPFMLMRDRNSVGMDRISKFTIQNFDDEFFVWDVTNQNQISRLNVNGNAVSGFWFVQQTDTLREFAICANENYLTPIFKGRVENQNLHGFRNLDYVIVTHPMFKSHAQQIADFHSNNEGFNVQVIDVRDIYNEFSGGAQDITAIKELMRMLYKRALAENGTLPKYLLLFGDASYDYKNKVSGNSNFIPSYQTMESLTPTASIVSDDYFGLLDDNEGQAANNLVDIGIGRFPARSRAEATAMVNKTLAYASTKSYGEWRTWMAFVSDDAESVGNPSVFMQDCDQLADIVADSASKMNVQKIYMDAFTQVAGSGGQRYPDGAAAISERVEKGALMMYYIGHGGELGWAHERILEVSTINKWTNTPKLPLFVTATCEFTRFDDPRRTSAGEYVMLNPSGGGVALLTTTRAVYGSPNLTLTTQFTKAAFSSLANGQQRLGDLTRVTKVRSLSVNDSTVVGENAQIADNTRCFTLLGDPALKLAYPEYNVEITEMPDTIRALDKVHVKGKVVDNAGVTLNDFNGIVIPVVFDKASKLRTLDNDGEGAYDYEERRSIIFRGKVQVVAGLFEFEFIVPKDIEKEYGPGKLSSYAYDETRDASGSYFDFIIGGLSEIPIVDEDGPDVKLYMNNTKFVFGGLTDENPDLYAELFDVSGINMVGSGIGHDIIGVLDGNSSNTLVLNDYYEADVNSYQSGKVRYPFNNLSEGLHTLRFQAWDVNNNPAEDYTEFVVASSAEIALNHILNYPNPFTTNTGFYFEHNKPGQQLDVFIDIFTVSGKLIKSIRGAYSSDGYRVGPISWDGLDEYGDNIGKGVYLYKLRVSTPQGQTAEQFERLVILN